MISQKIPRNTVPDRSISRVGSATVFSLLPFPKLLQGAYDYTAVRFSRVLRDRLALGESFLARAE